MQEKLLLILNIVLKERIESVYVYMVSSSDVKCLYRRSEAPFKVC